MNSLNKVGGKKFLKLIELEMIGLSFEHITFHNFREHLNKESRNVQDRESSGIGWRLSGETVCLI